MNKRQLKRLNPSQTQAIRRSVLLSAAVFASVMGWDTQAQTALPNSYAVPSSAVDKSKVGFLVRTWQSGSQPNTIAWTEEQLAGLHGANQADPAVFTDAIYGNKYLDETGVINYWDSGGEGNFPNDGTKNVPGLPGDVNNDNYSLEVFTVLDLPAGTVTLGVNSDDGFRVQALSVPDPRSRSGSLNLGQFDGGRGVADTTFQISVPAAGLYPFRLVYEEGGGDSAVEWFSVASDGTKHLLNDSSDSAAIKAYRQATSSKTVISTQLPPPGSTGISPDAAVTVALIDGSNPIDASTLKLSLDSTPLSVTATKANGVTTATYTPTTLYPAGSTHTVTFVYKESSALVTNSYTFTVANYATIPATAKVTPDTTKPGFTWRIFANSANQANNTQRTEDALAGRLVDADGNPLPNNADPSAQGVALAAASAPSAANGTILFAIPTVINLSQTGGENNANFPNDGQMPGVPQTDGSTDGMAAEMLTYIELPAGVIKMGVNSDDGFKTTAVNPQDAFGSVTLADTGGACCSDVYFTFVVEQPGVYPFRTVWEEGGGGANIEWFSFKADGSKVLINDTTNGGYKAYRARVGGTDPFVVSVTPSPAPRQLNVVSSSVSLTLSDGDTKKIDDSSIVLKIDGATVTTTKTRSGSTVTVTYTPTGLQIPTDAHTGELIFKDTTGAFTRDQTWTFYNLKNLVLPTPKVTENFDSYPEDTQPTGWVFWNYTAHCADGRDITSQTSESYENWVLVSVDNAPLIDGNVLNIAPGQVFNGQPVTSISSGNILYAESDSRCNTDALARGYVGQSQFITSAPFNLSNLTNVVLSFSALYEQNQDSYGGVEYSVDGGTTWLPVVYYLDTPDIVVKADGTVDAVATFTAPNADTSSWTINGKLYGAGANGYGDGVGAKISQDLALYIAPRINDDSHEGSRIEVYRLPKASLQKDVRLRFSAMGTDSWWFALDNIAFYDVGGAPPTTEQPKFNTVTLQNGSLSVSWTGTGTLQEATAVTGPWNKSGNQANPQTVSATGPAKFYRIIVP